MPKFFVDERVRVLSYDEACSNYLPGDAKRPATEGIIRSAPFYDNHPANASPGIHYLVDVIGYRRPYGTSPYFAVPEAFLRKLIDINEVVADAMKVPLEDECPTPA